MWVILSVLNNVEIWDEVIVVMYKSTFKQIFLTLILLYCIGVNLENNVGCYWL